MNMKRTSMLAVAASAIAFAVAATPAQADFLGLVATPGGTLDEGSGDLCVTVQNVLAGNDRLVKVRPFGSTETPLEQELDQGDSHTFAYGDEADDEFIAEIWYGSEATKLPMVGIACS